MHLMLDRCRAIADNSNMKQSKETKHEDYTMNKEAKQAYDAALQADEEFTQALTEEYGDNACNARYYFLSQHKSSKVVAAWLKFRTASDKWRMISQKLTGTEKSIA